MADIEKTKELLLAKKNEILSRIDNLEKDIRRQKDPLVEDSADQAIQKENDEVLDALDDASREEFGLINKALERIEQGTYQQCQACGKEIGNDRLEALPFADSCINCAS